MKPWIRHKILWWGSRFIKWYLRYSLGEGLSTSPSTKVEDEGLIYRWGIERIDPELQQFRDDLARPTEELC